jgi:pimeloyl-ACP methyl ester carboxylesterase
VKRFRHLAYLDDGTGEPLFLLHGGTMTAEWNWGETIPALAERFRVVAPDTRGHGASTNPAESLRYEDMVDDVLALAAHLGIERAGFYGFSDGAQVALELALREPSFATRLVLSGVLHELRPAYYEGLRAYLGAESFTDPRWEEAHPRWAAECRERHADWDGLAPQVWELWMRPLDYGDGLARVSVPALLLTGDRDEFAPVEQTVELFRLMPGAELAVIPGAGHDFGEPFTCAALEFLTRPGT